jgi:phytoene dehydrogenase-like protein
LFGSIRGFATQVMNRQNYDAIVIGAGPNGLAAAITLAKAGRSVLLIERAQSVGGSMRSAELTLPGFTHDVCSSVMALTPSSPFFAPILPELKAHGAQFILPAAPFAHPFDDGTAAIAERTVEETAARFEGGDATAYTKLFANLSRSWSSIVEDVMRPPIALPRHPLKLARFATNAIRSAKSLCASHFRGRDARALIAGVAGHAMIPLDQTASAAFALVLTAAAHNGGWPIIRGGVQKLADAMAALFRSLGGEIVTSWDVRSLDELPKSRGILCDVTPRQLLRIAGEKLPPTYRRQLEDFRYGPAAFKVDYALDAPVPWRCAECARAGTVHLGGTLDEIVESESAVARGEHPQPPYVLLVQPTLFDPTRAPPGKHVAWAYCHVPHGSTFDMTNRIEQQIERFAPGFRDRILARSVKSPAALESWNPNLIGGDISGGANDLRQLVGRPVLSANPYATPVDGLYLCSSSTPPGAGVHGMCGYLAARAALSKL